MLRSSNTLSRSCMECRRRKIRCDKSQPCSYCMKVRIRCTYPPPSNGSTQRTDRKPAIEDIEARFERLERTVQSFENGLSQVLQQLQTGFPPSPASDTRSNVHDLQQHREIGNDAAIELPTTPEWTNKDDDLCPIFKIPPNSTTDDLHPPTRLISFIWQRYLESVDRVLKIFHAPTIQKQVVDYSRGRGAIDQSFECLLFAIYYAAVVSMTSEECREELEEHKPELLKRYRLGVEISLSRAHLPKSSDMTVLQAYTIYLICGRRDDSGPDVRTLIGTATGMALRIGLHRDELGIGFSPFQIEMRRRLWWQIYVLDIRMAEDNGVSPRIQESWYDTKLPSNVNDASLNPEMRELRTNNSGKTELTFSLVRSEISNFTRRIIFNDRFCLENGYPVLSVRQKLEAIDRFWKRLERQYLSHCDENIGLDYVTANSSRLVLAMLKLTARKPRSRQDGDMLRLINFRSTCVDILKRCRQLRSHNKGREWQWLCKTYVEWDALRCLLFNLSLSPQGDGLDAAWETVEEVYGFWKMNGNVFRDQRWDRIEELRSKALLALELARDDPSRWEMPLENTSSLERPGTTITTTSPDIEERAPKRLRVDRSSTLTSSQQAQDPRVHSDVSIVLESREPHPDLLIANSTSDFQNVRDQEDIDLPTAGTAYQWSSAIFDSYFEVMASDQIFTSWF